jgi:hypothetical protein
LRSNFDLNAEAAPKTRDWIADVWGACANRS